MLPLLANSASQPQPIVLMSDSLELEKIIARAITRSHQERDQREQGEKRLTSQQAAEFLGRSVAYLQELHKQGLPYEKGRPNQYKLSDLEAFRAERRLQLT